MVRALDAAPLGGAEIVKQGADLTLFAWSHHLRTALETAAQLAGAGLDTEVMNLRTLQPLDADTILQSIEKSHRAAILQDEQAGVNPAAALVQLIQTSAFDQLDAPVEIVSCGARMAPAEAAAHAVQQILKALAG